MRFRSVYGCYQKSDGRDFILVSLHPGSKFSKKKNLSILKFWKADPRCYYIFTLFFMNRFGESSQFGPMSLILARKLHSISFRFPNLYLEGLAWDPYAQHFLVGSLRNRTIAAVSDVGVVETLITDSSLPKNVTVLGLAVDSANHRLLAVIHAADPLPHFDALVAYDLHSGNRLFLSLLPSDDVAVGTC
jgi:hypothetical protein